MGAIHAEERNMDIQSAMEMLNAEWRILIAAPILLGVVVGVVLFFGWAAAWFCFRHTLTRYKRRLEEYRQEIAKLQGRLTTGEHSYRVDRSELRLVIDNEKQAPATVFYMNVSKWCLLGQNFIRIDGEPDNDQDHGPVCLFILFDQPTKDGVLNVASDSVLPRYDIKEFNDRFAIIAFAGPIPVGTLEITVR
jgi:hypothetical protein